MILSRLKDAALEKALLAFLRPKIERYGEIRNLTLDTSEKIVAAELQLLTEPVPIVVSRARYRLEQRAADTFLIIYDVKISKEWAQNLLDDYFREIPIKIPELVRGLIK
jgi:hypothetical protein